MFIVEYYDGERWVFWRKFEFIFQAKFDCIELIESFSIVRIITIHNTYSKK